MKKSNLLFIGTLAISLSAYANQTISVNKNSSFAPVNWRITQVTGGLSLNNETSKSQFVQIVINEGSVGIFKRTKDGGTGCIASLGGNSVQKSTTCELAADETLFIDKDFSNPVDATGIYQVEMAS